MSPWSDTSGALVPADRPHLPDRRQQALTRPRAVERSWNAAAASDGEPAAAKTAHWVQSLQIGTLCCLV